MGHFVKALISQLADKANWLAGASIVAMMMVTVIDVVLRFFRCPIPGTYDVVGLLGALAISLSLGYTSAQKGHIAVDFLVSRFSEKVARGIHLFNNLVATVFFAAVSWQCLLYAASLKRAGEVSPTLKLPTYPFLIGIAAGFILLCCVLLAESVQSSPAKGGK
ncbi:TRAP transporter small permease [Desulfosudis oleivorans]|uniref:Tripartite ATP-independent periplasmic transporter DctQ component n=1 Tax=Desulfosudis oleivorans (strain DSM 6200 / JCM 39069 / Hxd3) TaxID=96561 RepID=A8ZTC3_DESOH|nr:TRAP transporter small permease [Desulfosudis oleivorans]ABW67806.1 Tripartite ATP-independent periplasmic transporter DctQ component [Desulfosudis oleivorans Hxd3]